MSTLTAPVRDYSELEPFIENGRVIMPRNYQPLLHPTLIEKTPSTNIKQKHVPSSTRNDLKLLPPKTMIIEPSEQAKSSSNYDFGQGPYQYDSEQISSSQQPTTIPSSSQQTSHDSKLINATTIPWSLDEIIQYVKTHINLPKVMQLIWKNVTRVNPYLPANTQEYKSVISYHNHTLRQLD